MNYEVLQKKLELLPQEYSKDIEIISLKVLIKSFENEENRKAIDQVLNSLLEKHPADEHIQNLFPKPQKLSLEELIQILEKDFTSDINFIVLKNSLTISEEEERRIVVNEILKEIYLDYSNNKNLKNLIAIFLQKEQQKIMSILDKYHDVEIPKEFKKFMLDNPLYKMVPYGLECQYKWTGGYEACIDCHIRVYGKTGKALKIQLLKEIDWNKNFIKK